MPLQNRKRVALLVETSLGSGREILRGIADYAHQFDRWHIFHFVRGLHEGVPDWMRGWKGDGVIARVQDARTLETLRKLEIPVVDVLGVAENSGLPLVHVDDRAIAKQVAEHFLSRSFKNCAFYGIAGENWSERRCAAFQSRCAGADFFDALETPRGLGQGFERAQEALQSWLRHLPKPVGIMVCSDQRGLELLEACREEGISVPERVAVVSVDNDLPLCEISSPQLSSVRAGHGRVGVEAARLLDTLMNGAAPPDRPVLLAPTGIVVRRSSDVEAIDDPLVAEGVHYMRNNLAAALTNESVARAVGISRTLFQQRFRKETGLTVRHYLIAERLLRARRLIETTDLTLPEIASLSGFRHQEYMGSVFKERLGTTPGALRKLALAEA